MAVQKEEEADFKAEEAKKAELNAKVEKVKAFEKEQEDIKDSIVGVEVIKKAPGVISDDEKAEKAKLAESNKKIAVLLKADEEEKALEIKKKEDLDAKMAPLNLGKIAIEKAEADFDAA